VELTPRPVAPVRRRRSPWAYGALVAVLLGLGFVVYQGLTSASLYFYNADEAVAQRADLGQKRFRVQGTVLDGTIEPTDEGVDFTITFNGTRVDVHHDGDPPELFQPGIPAVLEGHWDPSGDFFASDTIRVKHSEQYQADNQDRLDDAERGGTTVTTAP
jgi:cytochrome c-type biogenesis protein CcmE